MADVQVDVMEAGPITAGQVRRCAAEPLESIRGTRAGLGGHWPAGCFAEGCGLAPSRQQAASFGDPLGHPFCGANPRPFAVQVACVVAYVTAVVLWGFAEWGNYKNKHAK